MSEITLDEVRKLMDMLTGTSLPDNVLMTDQPQLTRRQASSVIWYLQECLRLIPEHYEMCGCGNLFDAHCSGHVVDGTDVPDEWQREVDVTQEMLEAGDGAEFCSPECEVAYWREMGEKHNE